MELKPYEIKAGESFDVTMEMNWQDSEDAEANKDWSLSIWSSKNPVTITHKGGLKSQAFPLITDEKADPNANANGRNASGGFKLPAPVIPTIEIFEPARPVKSESQTAIDKSAFDKLVNDSVPRFSTRDGRCKYDFKTAYKFNASW